MSESYFADMAEISTDTRVLGITWQHVTIFRNFVLNTKSKQLFTAHKIIKKIQEIADMLT